MIQELKQEVDILQKNPLFHMSLASKELFHSNFIAWIIEEETPFMNKVFSKYLKKIKIKDNKGYVEREKKNFDLLIHTEEGNEILIENKVKSYASKDQLEKYIKKTDSNNTIYVLLTTINPNFKIKDWVILNYEELLENMKQNISLIKKNIHYVNDYLKLIESIVRLHKLFEKSFNEKQLLFFGGGEFYRELQKIRMHDIYHKFIYHHKLKNLIDDLVEDENIQTGYYFSHGVAKTDCYMLTKFSNEKEGGLFFQLDDNKLCLYLVGDVNNKITEAKEVKSYYNILKTILEKYSSKFDSKQEKRLVWEKWNKFGNEYKYKYLALNESFTKDDLIDMFKLLINNMIKHKSILNKFNEVYK